MDRYDVLWIGGLFGLAVLMIVGFVGLGIWASSSSCVVRADKMGFPHSWGLMQGCMIEYKPGRWIDIDRYRAFDE